MSIHQIHFNRKFYHDNKSGYWISIDYSKERPRTRAHRWVWENIHGKIPKGYHIHHRNDDKSDNRIENLELIEGRRHLSYHNSSPIRKQRAREWAAKIRPLTKIWHASEEGKAWHKAHGILGWINKKEIEIVCKECQKTCKTKMYHQDFCSNNCKSKWRRKSGIDNVNLNCKLCNKVFIKNKYSKQVYCSRNCGFSRKIEKTPLDKRQCKHCNKTFEVERYKKKMFCGYSCSGKSSASKIKNDLLSNSSL